MKTEKEIEDLKANWIKDPCWDIEDTEGFEEHKEELLAYRLQIEADIQAEAIERTERRRRVVAMATAINNPKITDVIYTYGEIEHEINLLTHQIGDGGSAVEYANFIVARENVRATLLLAAHFQLVADLISIKVK
jgi:hypothetical protein